MAANYNQFKQAWDKMDNSQRKQYTEQYKNDSTFQQFAQQYNNEVNWWSINVQKVVNQANGNWNSNGWTDTQSNINNQNGNTSHYDPIYYRDNWGSSSDLWNWDGNTYWKTEFDKDEKLDTSAFWQDTGKIVVEQGRGKETWRPDYQLNTEDRLNEMRSNLDHYWATDKTLFSSRERFNEFFEYNQRQSDAQRALLDSYWKKAQDYNDVSKYTTWDSVTAWLNNWNFTEAQFNALKEYNTEAYIQWQKWMQEELNLAIANLADKFDIDTMTSSLEKIVNKLWIEVWDPYNIIDGWESMMERTGAWDALKEMDTHASRASDAAKEMQRITKTYASSTGWNQSDALVAARLQKALTPYQQIYSDEYNLYQMSRTSYQTKMWTATEYAATIQKQAQEDQRIFNQKIAALWFAMKVYDYRTPEQQAQLKLQTQQISNNMALLQQSQLNDLSLYNQYATGKMKSQLEYDLTDLNVTDEKQLKTNLKNVLDKYYEEYWDIILRPEQQVINDILEYAKANNVSVSEALKKNFIEQLQWKTEYQQAIADKYWTNPVQSIQKIWDKTALVTQYPNGKISYQILDDVYNTNYDIKTINWRQYLVVDDWKWVPQLKYIWNDWTVLNYASLTKWLQSFMTKYDDWDFYKDKWCWYFVNEYLTDIWDSWHVWSSWESKKSLCKNKDWENMVVWSIVAINSWATYKDNNGNDVNAWHVSIVAWYDPTTWKVTLYDANKDWDWKVRYWETTVDKLYWYYTPEIYKNTGTALPDYLNNVNEFWFVDSMVWNYGQYLMWKLNNVSINRLGWDEVLQKQINNWITYLDTKWKNKDWYIEWLEDLYENYLENWKLPASYALWTLWWIDEFKSQAKAYWEKTGYWRYAKVNEKWYYDDLVALYNEYIKSNKIPTEAQVEAYWWLDDFYKTARAYSQAVWFSYTPEEREKEISDMRDKWLSTQEYKDMMWRVDAMTSIEAMLTTGKWAYWDYTAIYLLNKLRDPDSVVREWEFANTQNVWGIDDRIYNYFQKLQNWERLNDAQRVEIQNTLNALMKAKIDVYNSSLRQYRGNALKWWDTSKIWTMLSISNVWKISFGNLTWDSIVPPNSDELE